MVNTLVDNIILLLQDHLYVKPSSVIDQLKGSKQAEFKFTCLDFKQNLQF